MLKISVITVAYNSAETIVDTLQSVASQSYGNVEHIVVDGGSTDGTASLIRANSDGVAYFISEADRGIYDAMNKGARLATGDLIGFLNSDDTFGHQDVLQWIAEAAAKGGAAAVYGDLVYVSQRLPERVIRHWRSGVYKLSALRRGWMPPHPTLYVRRKHYENADMFDISLRIAADYDFMLRLLSTPGLVVRYVPKVFVRMRTGGASNRSIRALWTKSREDLSVLRRHRIGGFATLLCKNFRKVPQLIARSGFKSSK